MTVQSHHTWWRKTARSSLKTKNEARASVPTSQYSSQHVPDIPSPATRPQKEANILQMAREEIKLSLFVDNIILHVGNPKEPTKLSRIKK